MMNEGIYHQIKNNKVLSCKGGLRLRHIALMCIQVFGSFRISYSKNIIRLAEELDEKVMHFKFLYKYNLL